jgi:hypothetical protein
MMIKVSRRMLLVKSAVALFRLSSAEIWRLAGMPSMRSIKPKNPDPFLLPPYPDGQT